MTEKRKKHVPKRTIQQDLPLYITALKEAADRLATDNLLKAGKTNKPDIPADLIKTAFYTWLDINPDDAGKLVFKNKMAASIKLRRLDEQGLFTEAGLRISALTGKTEPLKEALITIIESQTGVTVDRNYFQRSPSVDNPTSQTFESLRQALPVEGRRVIKDPRGLA